MHPVPHHFWDSHVAKWLEAASYGLASQPDEALEACVEEVVRLLEAAQQPDGYLNSYFQSVEPDARWTDLRDGHELYCAGHLVEAGVAHFQATRRRTLLEVVCRYADHIASVFGTAPGQKRGYCGHPEVELALVRLFRATGEQRFLELSRYFVDERGREPYYFDIEGSLRARPRASDGYYKRHGLRGMELRRYNQSHTPVRDQSTVVGHAVRAMYLYAAMADLARETHDDSLLQACQRLWSHLVGTRLYVTGGIGSAERNEGFSADFDLPNATAYAESCAAVGLVQWALRMFELTEHSAFTDVMERALYNAVAAALGEDGEHFFYANPLASLGHTHRQPWFEVACCPPNVARLLGSLGEYVYSANDERIAVHLYAQSRAKLCVAGQWVELCQQSDYPWNGRVRLTLGLDRPFAFGLWLRVPGWCRRAAFSLNGQPLRTTRVEGYVRVERTWRSGDIIDLELAMPVERVYSHPAVAANAGSVALQRGPVVYCLEQVDNPVSLHSIELPRGAPVKSRRADHVVTLHAEALRTNAHSWNHGQLYRTRRAAALIAHDLVAVPYATWNNRGLGEMRVWIREASP